MAIDTSRAGFVQQEYRYANATDTSVKALYPSAKAVVIASNFSMQVAEALAAVMLNETKTAAQVFTVPIEGIMTVDALSGGPPRYLMDEPSWSVNGRVMKLVGYSVDTDNNRTILKVRG